MMRGVALFGIVSLGLIAGGCGPDVKLKMVVANPQTGALGGSMNIARGETVETKLLVTASARGTPDIQVTPSCAPSSRSDSYARGVSCTFSPATFSTPSVVTMTITASAEAQDGTLMVDAQVNPTASSTEFSGIQVTVR